MKRMLSLVAFLAVLLGATSAFAQTATTQTTLSAAITAGQQTLTVASATGITAGSMLYIDREALLVTAISSTTATVQRGFSGTFAQAHAVGALTFASTANSPTPYIFGDPVGGCTIAAPVVQGVLVSVPAINVLTGWLWDCVRDASSAAATSDGFNNTGAVNAAASWRGSNLQANDFSFVMRTPVINPNTAALGFGYQIKINDYLVAVTSLTTNAVQGINLTLPAATGMNGKTIIIKDENGFVNTNLVMTVVGTIDGATNQVLAVAYTNFKIYSDGRQWHRW